MRGSYSPQQIDISFTSGENQLSGIIVKPGTDKLSNAIVLVHGSGPVDRDSNGSFVALRERFARLGYVVLCYDKLGVGESTGDWRKQTFEDRAQEVLSAIRFLKTHPLQIQGVGLCGGSQAGWIMPIVAQLTEPVAFIISISSAAVTVEEQERYRIERQLRGDHFSDEQVSQALSIYARRLDMIRQGAKAKQIATMQDSAMEEPWFPYLGDTTRRTSGFSSAYIDSTPSRY